MKLGPFAMERLQSTLENRVALNVSESGVHPLRLGGLRDNDAAVAALLAQPLAYLQTNGTDELRASIAAMYLRIGFGGDRARLQESLERIGATLDCFPAHAR